MTGVGTRSLVGRGLFYGTPVVAAAVTLTFAFLERRAGLPAGGYRDAILFGNAAIAAAGPAVAAAIGRGGAARRLAVGLAAAVVGSFAYALLFVAGMIAMAE